MAVKKPPPPGNGCIIKSGKMAATIAMAMWKGENFIGSQTETKNNRQLITVERWGVKPIPVISPLTCCLIQSDQAWNYIHTNNKSKLSRLYMSVYMWIYAYVCNNNKQRKRLSTWTWEGIGGVRKEVAGRVYLFTVGRKGMGIK